MRMQLLPGSLFTSPKKAWGRGYQPTCSFQHATQDTNRVHSSELPTSCTVSMVTTIL